MRAAAPVRLRVELEGVAMSLYQDLGVTLGRKHPVSIGNTCRRSRKCGSAGLLQEAKGTLLARGVGTTLRVSNECLDAFGRFDAHLRRVQIPGQVPELGSRGREMQYERIDGHRGECKGRAGLCDQAALELHEWRWSSEDFVMTFPVVVKIWTLGVGK